MSNHPRIVVMIGGPGDERDVSLSSGKAVVEALRSLGHEVQTVDPVHRSFSLPEGTDIVFLALHGEYGEDGTVQEQLENLGVPYTGCGVESSRTAFDKVLTKEACIKAQVLTPRYMVCETSDAPWPSGWQPPVVLKPVCQGSSVGLQFINRIEDWPDALIQSLKHGQQVLVEKQISGRECTVGILDGQPLPVVEVYPHSGVYDYQSKYTTGASEYRCPAPLEPTVTEVVQTAGLAAFDAIGGRDYGRVDIIIDSEGRPWVLEVNTLPGMTETSLLPKAAAAVGIGYAQLCERMMELALSRRVERGHLPAAALNSSVERN